MKKIIAAGALGLLALMSILAYALSFSLDFLSSQKFVINGRQMEFPVIDYNGHVYVPLRFVAENMASDVGYNASTGITSIDQHSVRFDDVVAAPKPEVVYEKRLGNGSVWMQDIPLLQGNSCWAGCIQDPRSDLTMLKQAEYPAVDVKPGAYIGIRYPKGMEPKRMESSFITNVGGKEKFMVINMDQGRIRLPGEPGIYSILLRSYWDQGDTTYLFAVKIS
ncbi:stalk domain-containing protein [Paenibacillus sp. UNC499MF]|uniref:stalk domain-containing protein n=1 Tax=Paenibacillus sp. UNC499MF TaxID=1502751 RepID=UPI0008A02C87|nr:stalk domain-containing protein [Paenibacillus sp. UNC499MF]SEG51702.1 Copper amine oxidase N-terminal domain-containing protein [Paenibacillus sp. UNC499MF]